jgi:hypothetical protein
MKFLLTLIFSAIVFCSNAQTCFSHALMRKGTQLEYKIHNSGYRNGQLLRLIFEVADVADSAHSTISTVVKKFFGSDAKNDHYERTIRLQCDEKNLLMPFDFLLQDTTYFFDTQGNVKNSGYFAGSVPLVNANYVFPLTLDGVTRLEGIKDAKLKATKRSFTQPSFGGRRENFGIWLIDYEILYTVNEMKVEGKETINTAAGAFECYIIRFDCDTKVDNQPFQLKNAMSLPLKYTIYYNSEIGIVKSETSYQRGRNKWQIGESVELVSIQK